MASRTLSVIIPAYNEERTIVQILDKVVPVDLSSLDTQKEIIVVNDGSKDKTRELVEQYIKEHPGSSIRLINKENGGKGSAMREGIQHATGDYILPQDADLEYEPEDYPALLKPLLDGTADVVYGSRPLGEWKKRGGLSRLRPMGGKTPGSGFWPYAGGRFLSIEASLLYGIRISDEPTCYKLFKADLLKSLPLQCQKFEFCPEVTAKAAKRGARFTEVPIRYYPRSYKEGKKMRVSDGLEAIWTLLKLRFTDNL